MKIICTTILVIVFFSSCKKQFDTSLMIENKSNFAIYVAIDDEFLDSNYVNTDYYPVNDSINSKIYPGMSKSAIIVPVSWEAFYKDINIASFYFFDAEIMESIAWDTIRNNYMILDRYDLTYTDLETFKWKLVYPRDSIR